MMKKILIAALLALALAGVSGCSVFGGSAEVKKESRDAAVAQYGADSLRNYISGRDYAAQGRYELAREHYLLALAATDDPYLQDALAKELESVDLMIRSLR